MSKEQGAHSAGKTSDCEATRRDSNKPKAEKVRDAKEVKDGHKNAVLQQNRNDQDDSSLTVIPTRSISNPPSTQAASNNQSGRATPPQQILQETFMQVTNENLIIGLGGHAQKGFGSQRHLPIFKDEDGNEFVSFDGQVLTPVKNMNLEDTRREVVER